MAFVTFIPGTNSLTSLATAIFTPSAGATLVANSVTARYGTDGGEASTISYYNGSQVALGIGVGLLLTSGDPTPPESNTLTGENGLSVDSDFSDDTDSDLLASITAAYDGTDPEGVDGVRDITWIQFQVNITDPALIGMKVDIVFGSEEYPEYVSEFPDIAGVYVNGVNSALFNGNVLQPLAVLNANMGRFIDNTGGVLPIEYDGVTGRLQVTAPVNMGVNTIKIGVADTGQEDYDAGLFVSSMQAVAYDAFGQGIITRVGVVGTANVNDTAGSQLYIGNAAANELTLSAGRDVFDGGAGVDTVNYAFNPAGINMASSSWNGRTLELHNGANASQAVNIERIGFTGNYLFALDTQVGGNTWATYALLYAGANTAPPPSVLSQWLAITDVQLAAGGNLGDVADLVLDFYAPTASDQQVIAAIYQNVAGVTPSSATVDEIAALIGGPGDPFQTIGDFYAFAAMLPENTGDFAGIVGSVQQLDAAYF